MRSVLDTLGISRDALLGYGGEAEVYALDAERVARVHRSGASPSIVAARVALLFEMARSADRVPFAIPRVLEQREIDGHLVHIEARLPGRDMMRALPEYKGERRDALVRAYMDAAAAVGDIVVERPWYGELLDPKGVHVDTFRSYLALRAEQNLDRAGDAFAHVDAAELAAELPEPHAASLVHLDYFPGNVLVEGERITAVIDFGTISIIGDRRLDPLAAVAYLDPPISPAATDRDRAVAHEWLAAHDLERWYEPARRWLAAFWSPCDDPRPAGWARAILVD